VEVLENRSLTKYKLIIDEFGGWELFQTVLHALRTVADRHTSHRHFHPKSGAAGSAAGLITISGVAIAWVLQQPAVAAVITGVSGRNTSQPRHPIAHPVTLLHMALHRVRLRQTTSRHNRTRTTRRSDAAQPTFAPPPEVAGVKRACLVVLFGLFFLAVFVGCSLRLFLYCVVYTGSIMFFVFCSIFYIGSIPSQQHPFDRSTSASDDVPVYTVVSC
jgi:hypothetical protein